MLDRDLRIWISQGLPACLLAMWMAALPAEAGALTQQEYRTAAGPADHQDVARRAFADTAGFADVVDRVKSAVIGVRAGSGNAPRESRGRALPDSPFESPLPGLRGPRQRPRVPGSPEGAPQAATQGSGFFISADGYAVTNRHVVEGDRMPQIQTEDQKTYRARVIGVDSVSDLALLKVDDRNDFPHVKLADKQPRVGDWILAIGNPFGLGGTVTAGIVSARERNVGTKSYGDLLQIDAPINRRDSGGPTFDLEGNVIGVNTMILSPSGGSVGFAFAIPADTVSMVVTQLREKGSVTRGWLGVQIQSLTAEIAESLGFDNTKGALVAQPQPDSPAAKAGLRSGDIITSLNDEPVGDPRTLSRKVAASAPRSSVKLGVFRRGDTATVDVTLGEFPNNPAGAGR
jgi:serine protease Do